MTATAPGTAEADADAARAFASRYGRDKRTDKQLKTAGAVLGVLFLVVVGWLGWSYIAGQKLSAEVISFDVSSDQHVKVHLEVRKAKDAHGTCTVRSQAADGAEVGRADFRFAQSAQRVDKVVTLRTTARGTTAELIGCHAD
ncbi:MULTISPECIES: DUF4307 domain-containing protein [Streptomyces]|uniref:DUF4307 domain-containing protein n=1 Tax=Streptomyces evansiae TaxID=3075535 RepID=A0ABD5E0S3_9ACTN|nr:MULTISPECIES: DUF4307 domain-containing protein [unclassified Streptomyces]ASY34693.1 hypothetical protein CAC01_20100 [Streptomyces sp. CLI2509]EFL00118.1 conserved hypothetical protein [Streptomyces sp. SPB78]EGJ77055.1 hypothetical protein STTU_4266 [Streptomyces sp. Tu6071]MDT0414268.1 DUF4307 domain-containing protein [Streptomyces sp. DSM 41982]MDT0419984.1 DUF4307 domain-containing protein [Streptomyces sp. DSM 41859]